MKTVELEQSTTSAATRSTGTTMKALEMPMTYQERYDKTNAWSARRIAKDLMLMNGKNEIVSEHDEHTICDAESGDAAMRQLVKPQAKPRLPA